LKEICLLLTESVGGLKSDIFMSRLLQNHLHRFVIIPLYFEIRNPCIALGGFNPGGIANAVMWSEQAAHEVLQYVFDLYWTSIPGAILDSPALAWNPVASKLQMVVRGGGDSIWAGTFDSNGTFNNDWTQIPGAILSPPALAWNPSAGKMKMVVRGGGNTIWAATFSNSGPTISFDSNWTQIPGAILSAPALAWIPAPTNKMWMLVQGGGNTIWKASFGTSGSNISFDGNWAQIPGAILSAPALAWNPNYSGVGSGRMQMVVRGGGDSIWAATFNSNGTFNSDWTHIPGGTPSSPGGVYLPSMNFICIVIRGLDNSIWRTLY
jgi:hypothetical protein